LSKDDRAWFGSATFFIRCAPGAHVPATFIDLAPSRPYPVGPHRPHAGGIRRFRLSWRRSGFLFPVDFSPQFDPATL